jgi:hypothetical protein
MNMIRAVGLREEDDRVNSDLRDYYHEQEKEENPEPEEETIFRDEAEDREKVELPGNKEWKELQARPYDSLSIVLEAAVKATEKLLKDYKTDKYKTRYYIRFLGVDSNVLDVTFFVINELSMPKWFRWDFYEIVAE